MSRKEKIVCFGEEGSEFNLENCDEIVLIKPQNETFAVSVKKATKHLTSQQRQQFRDEKLIINKLLHQSKSELQEVQRKSKIIGSKKKNLEKRIKKIVVLRDKSREIIDETLSNTLIDDVYKLVEKLKLTESNDGQIGKLTIEFKKVQEEADIWKKEVKTKSKAFKLAKKQLKEIEQRESEAVKHVVKHEKIQEKAKKVQQKAKLKSIEHKEKFESLYISRTNPIYRILQNFKISILGQKYKSEIFLKADLFNPELSGSIVDRKNWPNILKILTPASKVNVLLDGTKIIIQIKHGVIQKNCIQCENSCRINRVGKHPCKFGELESAISAFKKDLLQSDKLNCEMRDVYFQIKNKSSWKKKFTHPASIRLNREQKSFILNYLNYMKERKPLFSFSPVIDSKSNTIREIQDYFQGISDYFTEYHLGFIVYWLYKARKKMNKYEIQKSFNLITNINHNVTYSEL